MKKTNLQKIMMLIIVLLTSFPTILLAHSGKTDSNGGHYDSSTGEYHYHHGYPAHQHPNGICPYDDASEITFDTYTPRNEETKKTSKNTNTGNSTNNEITNKTIKIEKNSIYLIINDDIWYLSIYEVILWISIILIVLFLIFYMIYKRK